MRHSLSNEERIPEAAGETVEAGHSGGRTDIHGNVFLRHTVILALYTVLTVAMTYPMVRRLDTHLVGDDIDVWINPWANWWLEKAITERLDPYHTDYILYPQGDSLVFHSLSPLNTAVWWLLKRLWGTITSYNLSVLLAYPLSGYGMWYLARYWTGDDRAAFLAALVLARPARRWLAHILIVAVVVGSVAALLVGVGEEIAVASFRTVLTRNSYATDWALIDGNLTSGMVGSPQEHLALQNAAAPPGTPSRVPTWLKTAIFALLGLFIFLQAGLRGSPRRLVAFVALTLMIFSMWSRGWSPQWQLFLFPLILLTLPYRRAFFFVVVLSFVNFLGRPLFLARDIHCELHLTALLRPVVVVVLGLDLWRQVQGHRLLLAGTSRNQAPGRIPELGNAREPWWKPEGRFRG